MSFGVEHLFAFGVILDGGTLRGFFVGFVGSLGHFLAFWPYSARLLGKLNYFF